MHLSEQPDTIYTNFRKVMCPRHDLIACGPVIEEISSNEVFSIADIKTGQYCVPDEYDYAYFLYQEKRSEKIAEIKTGRVFPNPTLLINIDEAKGKFRVECPGTGSIMYAVMLGPALASHQAFKSRSKLIYLLKNTDFIIRGADWKWRLTDT